MSTINVKEQEIINIFNNAIENHKKLWNWIADETLRSCRKVKKSEYFKANKVGYAKSSCYCCQFVEDIREVVNIVPFCSCHVLCPINWNTESCTENDSLYMKWEGAVEWYDCYKFAKQIAELEPNIEALAKLLDIVREGESKHE
uniref:Uncharacterized protein n=1 Tax=Dulem virus 36 TaxID=3145754 RepID=A0AAU8B0Y0_9CAUD